VMRNADSGLLDVVYIWCRVGQGVDEEWKGEDEVEVWKLAWEEVVVGEEGMIRSRSGKRDLSCNDAFLDRAGMRNERAWHEDVSTRVSKGVIHSSSSKA
jgi:hypothetical protein